jgi:putative aldouronate transport system permease protein
MIFPIDNSKFHILKCTYKNTCCYLFYPTRFSVESRAEVRNLERAAIFNVKKTKAVAAKPLYHYLRRDWVLYAMLLLPLAHIFLFSYVPFYGLQIAFKDYNLMKGYAGSPWVGFDIFKQIFGMKDFYRALRNTIVLNGLDLVLGFPAPVILAILLNELRVKWFKRTAQTILYVPHFLSWVIISGIMYQLLSPESGLVNILIKNAGGTPIQFLTDKYLWVLSYCMIGVWQNIGWGTIIYLAAITGINAELYEAATVDGAGRFRKMWHVTLPGIKATIVVMVIISVGRILSIGFDRPFALYNPRVMETSDVISTYVYRIGIRSWQYNKATAVGLFQSVAAMILVLVTDFAAKRSGEQGLL